MLTCGGAFDGIGLLAYGLHLAGWQHRWLCEADPWRRTILEQRWPGIPVYPDIRELRGTDVEPVLLFAGGFPCKGISSAGKRTGFGHPESVLWREMARTIGELRPRYVLVENVRDLLSLHDGELFGEVLGDLAAFGFDVVWDCLPAAAVGAPHRRDRVFAVATYTDGAREQRNAGQRSEPNGRADVGRGDQDASHTGCERGELRRGPAGVAGEGDAAQSQAQQRQRARDAAGDSGQAPPDASRDAEGGSAAATGADRKRARAGDHATADPRGGGREEQPAEHGPEPALHLRHAQRRGVPVEWREYEPAIARWEAVHGPAPEPLVCRVDDRAAGRVERSRLSALGDGVQVQVGQIVGTYIAELERARLREVA